MTFSYKAESAPLAFAAASSWCEEIVDSDSKILGKTKTL